MKERDEGGEEYITAWKKSDMGRKSMRILPTICQQTKSTQDKLLEKKYLKLSGNIGGGNRCKGRGQKIEP